MSVLDKLNKKAVKLNKEGIPGETEISNPPLGADQAGRAHFEYLTDSDEYEKETEEEVESTLGVVHISRPSIQRVFFLFRPLLKPVLEAFNKQQQQLDELVKIMILEHEFIDRAFAISQNVGYQVDYKGRRFLYLLTYQALTIVVGGNNIVLTPGKWTLVTFPQGTTIYGSGVSDGNPIMVVVRACDFPLPLDTISLLGGTNFIGNVQVASGVNTIGNVGTLGLPVNATQENASAQGTNLAAVATLAGAAGKFTYLTGIEIDASAAPAAATTMTIAGVVGGPLTYEIPTAVAAIKDPQFTMPLQSSAQNTAIVVTLNALGVGIIGSVNAHGYVL